MRLDRCTIATQPRLTEHLMEAVADPHPSSLRLTELTQPLAMMFRAEPTFPSPIVDCGVPSAAGGPKAARDSHDTAMRGHYG